MNPRTIKFNIDGYRYGDRLLEGVMFEVTTNIHDNANKPFTIDSVTPSTNTDKKYLLHIGGQGAIDKWTGEILDDLQDDPYTAFEELIEDDRLSEEEENWIEDYCWNIKDRPEPMVVEVTNFNLSDILKNK